MSTTIDVTNTAVYERRKSQIRSCWRSADAIFDTASDGIMRDLDGREYIDCLWSAGSLNNRHNGLHMIAAGRYHRIPAGHDAIGIASGDARRVGQRPSRSPDAAGPLGRSTAAPIHAAALLEYLVRDGINPRLRNYGQQRTALL